MPQHSDTHLHIQTYTPQVMASAEGESGFFTVWIMLLNGHTHPEMDTTKVQLGEPVRSGLLTGIWIGNYLQEQKWQLHHQDHPPQHGWQVTKAGNLEFLHTTKWLWSKLPLGSWSGLNLFCSLASCPLRRTLSSYCLLWQGDRNEFGRKLLLKN